MSPLELLKTGILEQNFPKITEAYERMTGESLKNGKAKLKNARITSPSKVKKAVIITPGDDEFDEAVEELSDDERIGAEFTPDDAEDEEYEDEYDVRQYEIPKNENVPDEYKDKKKCRREPINVKKIQAIGNMFDDDGSLGERDPKDKKITKQLASGKISKHHRRPPVKMKKYKCQGDCGKTFVLSPAVVPNGVYICHKCIKRKIGK